MEGPRVLLMPSDVVAVSLPGHIDGYSPGSSPVIVITNIPGEQLGFAHRIRRAHHHI